MFEIIREATDKIFLRKITRCSLIEGEIIVSIASSFFELPIELGCEKNSDYTPEANQQAEIFEVSSVGVVTGIKNPISEIRKGEWVVTGLMGYTDGVLNLRGEDIIKIGKIRDVETLRFMGLGAGVLKVAREAGVEMGAKILIVGQGVKGQLLAQVCHHYGAQVSIFDTSKSRLDAAANLMANLTVISDTSSKELRPDSACSYGFDVVFVAGVIQSQELWDKIWDVVRPSGRVVMLYPQRIQIKSELFALKNATIIINVGYKTWQDYFPQARLTLPFGYVRWDWKRDMEEFASMISKGRIERIKLMFKELNVGEEVKDQVLDIDPKCSGVFLTFFPNQ